MEKNTAFNNEGVEKQLRHMISFIKREASEKASEILVKAQEQFAREKTEAIREAKNQITKDFEKKQQAVGRKKKISHSHALNASRLEVLKEKEKIVDEVLKKGKDKLEKLGNPKDPAYKKLLQQLLTQGLLALSEPQVTVRYRKVDEELVESILKECVEEYKKRAGKNLVANLDKENNLFPPKSENSNNYCSGGILVIGYNGRIVCDNTLDQRLLLAYEGLVPKIRVTLFGASETRKYKY